MTDATIDPPISSAVQDAQYLDDDINEEELKMLHDEYGHLFQSKDQFKYFCMLPLSLDQRVSFVLALMEAQYKAKLAEEKSTSSELNQ